MSIVTTLFKQALERMQSLLASFLGEWMPFAPAQTDAQGTLLGEMVELGISGMLEVVVVSMLGAFVGTTANSVHGHMLMRFEWSTALFIVAALATLSVIG